MRLLAITCMRDEAPYVVDWLAHHRRMGVTDVLVYTNDCIDGTEALLDALAQAGVTHIRQGAVAGGKRPPQWMALRAAWDHPLRAACDWALHVDVDEYVCPLGVADLPGLIAAMPDADAIALPWRLFGNAGHARMGPDPVPQRFDRAAPPALAYPLLASFFKTLFRLDGPFDGIRVHRPSQTAPPAFYDDTGTARPDLAQAPGRIRLWRAGQVPDGRLVQLNHYSLRSVEEFLLKRLRGLPNATDKALDMTYWIERNFNTVQERSIARHLPALAEEAARLRALPGVAEAEAAGRAHHAARLERLLADEATVRLAGRLCMAQGSAQPPADQTRWLLELMARQSPHQSQGGGQ